MSKDHSLRSLKSLLFTFHATNTIIISFLPLYLKFKGLNGTEIGWVLAIGPLASIFSQPFWGYMSDKYKTIKRMLIICVFGLLISSVIFFQMNGFLAIFIMGAILYFFSSPVGALSDSLAQRRADELRISFGTIRTWGSIGFAFSALVVGGILSSTHISNMGIIYILFGLIMLFIVFRITDVNVESDPVQLKDVNKLIHNKPLIFFLILMMFITITHRANDSFIGLYIAELGGAEGFVGIAWFIGLVSEAIVFATSRYWFRKYHALTFIVIASVIYTFRWFLFAAIDLPIYIIILQVLHGVTFGIFYVAAFEYVTRITPKLLHSTAHLVYYSVFFGVSGIIGSSVGGTVMDVYGGHILYNSMGYLALAGTFCIFVYQFLMPKKEKQITSD